LPQLVVAPGLQVPPTTQVLAVVCELDVVPSVQDAGTHTLPRVYFAQPMPLALHAPLVPHDRTP
jgi:hypothetical protein